MGTVNLKPASLEGDSLETTEVEPTNEIKPTNRGKKTWKVIITVAVVLVLVVLLHYLGVIRVGFLPRLNSGYQAVFLDNGQVYFGKLYAENSQYPVLKDIYYLQVTQPPQPLREGETPPANINLVKLGAELHGPADEMRINRDHILFIEDLTSGSRVMQAIVQFQQTPVQ